MTHLNAEPSATRPGWSGLITPSVDSLGGADTVNAPSVVALATIDAPVAANDETEVSELPNRNPLWIIVMGMAALFGVMAAVMAVG
jgi:hypothetical protein